MPKRKLTLQRVAGKLLYSAPKKAIVSKGFQKAFFYSFGSWLCFWGLQWGTTNEAIELLSQYGWAIPLLNVLLVFVKQYLDELRR